MENDMTKKLLSAFIICLFIASLIAVGCGKKATDSTGYAPDLATEYLVTQYADASGVQGVCYTIENDSSFIIIDGGWDANADALREIISSHGNKVDAWIISHPHQDHAGAFNAIMRDPGDITVGNIYDNGFDYDFIESVGEPYDDITVMEDYHEITSGLSNVVHFVRDKDYEICGLDFHILNAYDDIVLATVGGERDYQNNASLMFIIESTSSRMLFASDIKYDMDEYLLSAYGDEISCDYVQAGHHGNWSLSDEFYAKTGASVFFIDAPASITDNESFPASTLKASLISQGKTVYDFESAPNSVTLR
jgi:beta-lactamase superfamily II metal-dependent hydrolase